MTSKPIINSLFLAFCGGLVSGSITLGTMVWEGGALARTVETHTQQITTLNTEMKELSVVGSVELQKHEAVDVELRKRYDEKYNQVAAMLGTLQELKTDMKWIRSSMKDMQEKGKL